MENTTDLFPDGLKDRSLGTKLVQSAVITLLNILSFCGNISVCWIIYNCQNLRTVPNLFVLSLAITDICVSLLVIPLTLTTLFSSEWILGPAVCKLQGYFMLTLGMTSLLTLTGIAINRYFVIVKSIEYKHIFTKRRTIVFIFSIWVFSGIICSFPIFLKSPSYTYFSGKASCFFPFESSLVATLILELVFIGMPLNIMIFCYYKVFREVRRTKRRINVGWRENPRRYGQTREELRVTQTLSFVLIGFCMCWLPVSLIDFLDLYNGGPTLPRQVYFLYIVLLYTSSTINPLIYGLSSRQFRTEYRLFFDRCRSTYSAETTTKESLSAKVFKVPEVVVQTACTSLDIATSHDLNLQTPQSTSQIATHSNIVATTDIATSYDFPQASHTLDIVIHSRPHTTSDIVTAYDLEVTDKSPDLGDPSSYDLL